LLQGRLVSLDFFRGLAIALMILVNNPGGDKYYGLLQHVDWNGLTVADLVFPFFVFIMGAAIPYSLAGKLERGENKQKLLVRIIRRTVILFALGLIINGFPYYDLATLRVMGVLQRIALCYFFASITFLFASKRWQIVLTMVAPVVYWMLMVLIPVPGYGAGILDKQGNLAGYVDRFLLGGHLYAVAWDPEGLLSTLPAFVTAMTGVLIGQSLKSNSRPSNKCLNLLLVGSLSIAAGLVWNFWFPINKNLWTSSYVALTSGLAIVILAACFYVIDVRSLRSWTKPFVILGINAITVYFLSEIVNLSLIYVEIPFGGINAGLKSLIYEELFASWAGPLHGSFIYALAYLAFCWIIALMLWKKGVFLKI
jgi:predicted acyltransferase